MVEEIPLIICANIQTLKLFHLLVEMVLVNISIRKEVQQVRESKSIWELKIMELSCQTLKKKMLSMQWSVLYLALQDKGAWLYQYQLWLVKLKIGSQIWLKRLKD